MPWVSHNKPSVLERVVSSLCYLTFGLVGLLYIVISGTRSQSPFLRFHFLQSIILGILGVLLGWTSGIFVSLLASALGLFDSLAPGLGTQAAYWLGIAMSVLVRAAYLLLLYGMLGALFGKCTEIPFISNLVRQQMR